MVYCELVFSGHFHLLFDISLRCLRISRLDSHNRPSSLTAIFSHNSLGFNTPFHFYLVELFNDTIHWSFPYIIILPPIIARFMHLPIAFACP
jgi:hypothetical protein